MGLESRTDPHFRRARRGRPRLSGIHQPSVREVSGPAYSKIGFDRGLYEPPAGRTVAIASAAWDLPGLDSLETLDAAYRKRRIAPRAPLPEAALRLRNVCGAALDRAGRRWLRADPGLEGLMIGDGPASWPLMRSSFAALVSAFRSIQSGRSQRLLVAGQPQFGGNLGACAVLLEAESCMEEGLRGRRHLNLLACAEGRAGVQEGSGVLALLQRHAEKTLYISATHALRAALGIIASPGRLQLKDLAADVPPDANCLCLLQLIAFFERHAGGDAQHAPGAVFSNDGPLASSPAGILIVAPAGHATEAMLSD
jgi:hypothetical protein